MSKILVTGAAGFIGSHVTDYLVNAGHDVVATDSLSGGFVENVNQDVAEWITGNLSDITFVEMLFRELGPFNTVYHIAAYAAEGLSHFIRSYNYQTNLMASINLINESVLHHVKRFVFTSSIAVYGSGKVPFTETTVPEPEDPYGISKYAVELDLKAACKQFGLNYTIFRPHNVYGPRQNISDPYRNVIGLFMRQVMNKEPMTIFGDGLQTRAFTYIDDVAPMIGKAWYMHPDSKNQVFNIGTDTKYTILELAQLVADAFEVECSVKFLPARNEVEHAFSEHKRARQAFKDWGFTGLEEGLANMVDWVRERGVPDATPFRGNIEVPINMPPSWKHISESKVSN